MDQAASCFARAEEFRRGVRLHEAIDYYSRAEALGYDAAQCRAGRWTCHMLAGHWQQAWLESDRIAQLPIRDPHQFWQGEDWTGKDVLIRCLHGLGDTLQFIRYVPQVRRLARSVTIEAQPKLKELLRKADLADAVITWGDSEPAWQVQMEVNELPRLFRTVEETIPGGVPYLRASRRVRTPAGPAGALRVGLVWAASNFDPSRNVPLELFRPLLEIQDISVFSLQAGDGWQGSLPRGLESLSDQDTSIEDIADEMTGLDLILTVDTMNAHLAGALGRPTWTMLPFVCDWRWMVGREDSPWYPTMRLFRQRSPGDWQNVIEHVRVALVRGLEVKKRQLGSSRLA